MTALIAFLTGLTTLITYTIYIVSKYGVQESFSDSYYALENDKEGKGKLFGITMIIMTFSFAIAMLSLTAGYWWQFIGFLAIAPIGFVGVAAAFREGGLTKKVHMANAKMAAVFSLVWVLAVGIDITAIAYLSIPISIALFLAAWGLDDWRNKVWWAEYVCFGWVIITILTLIKLWQLSQ